MFRLILWSCWCQEPGQKVNGPNFMAKNHKGHWRSRHRLGCTKHLIFGNPPGSAVNANFPTSICSGRYVSQKMSQLMENDLTVHEYCMKEVEPMATECEQLHIIALTQQVGDLMQASVQIEYLDNSSGEKTNQLTFPDQYAPFLHLLYRPGHYDILQPRTDKS